MSEIGNNVYLILEIVKADKSGLAYNLFMRASKPFYEFVSKNQKLGAELRDSFLCKSISKWDRSTLCMFRGNLHRVDGPALIERRQHMNSPYAHRWYYCGRLHRVGGPAIIFADGRKEYYANGRKVTAKKAGDTVGFVGRRRATRFEPY